MQNHLYRQCHLMRLKEELPDNINKRILVFERASAIELLNTVHGAFYAFIQMRMKSRAGLDSKAL